MSISLLLSVISRLLTLIKTICFNNIPVIIRLLKPGIRLNNIVYEILILLVKELLLSLKNLGINIIKVSFLNFVNKFLFKVLSSNKVSLTEQILEVFEILIIKKIINLKNINFILGGSIYCTINNINILETNLFIYITIIIYFVYFYNVILEHDSLNSTFLGRNWFKLILTGLILICILFIFVEIIYIINSLCHMLISKFFWTKYNDPIINTGKQGESSGGSSGGPGGPTGSSGGPTGSGGPGGPSGYDPSAAAAGSITNQNSNSEGTSGTCYDPIRDPDMSGLYPYSCGVTGRGPFGKSSWPCMDRANRGLREDDVRLTQEEKLNHRLLRTREYRQNMYREYSFYRAEINRFPVFSFKKGDNSIHRIIIAKRSLNKEYKSLFEKNENDPNFQNIIRARQKYSEEVFKQWKKGTKWSPNIQSEQSIQNEIAAHINFEKLWQSAAKTY